MRAGRRAAFDSFATGARAMAVAERELKMPKYAVRVAGSHGVGSAIEHVRKVEAKRRARRAMQKASRRGNR